MKITIPVLSKITMAAVLAGSILACNKPQPADKPVQPATTDAAKETVVYINQDTLLNKYQFAMDITKSLQDKGKAAKTEIQGRVDAFQAEVADYQKSAGTMAADQRQTKEQHLQREQQDLQNHQQDAAAGFQNEQVSANNKVYDTIANFAKGYAKEKGYKLVLMYSKANPTILYGDQTLDVTADVIKRLNEAYAKVKK
jgi:outer membrane protein